MVKDWKKVREIGLTGVLGQWVIFFLLYYVYIDSGNQKGKIFRYLGAIWYFYKMIFFAEMIILIS